MSARKDSELAASESQPGGQDTLVPVQVRPILRSPHAICRWELDVAMPAERSREIAVGFCGALLQRLGKAVDEVVVEDRLAVLTLPRIPVSATSGEAGAVGLLVPRAPSERSRRALRDAIRSIGREGFHVAGRSLRLRSVRSKAFESRRWVGPSHVWTSVTPGFQRSAKRKGSRANVGAICSTRSARCSSVTGTKRSGPFGDGGLGDGAAGPRRGLGSPGYRRQVRHSMSARPRRHMCEFAFGPRSRGPIVIGRDRLLGMGLLVPVDPPIVPFE